MYFEFEWSTKDLMLKGIVKARRVIECNYLIRKYEEADMMIFKILKEEILFSTRRDKVTVS